MVFQPRERHAKSSYTYSDYYKSSVRTEVLVKFIDTQGDPTYRWLRGASASSNWQRVSTTFTTPANVSQLTVLHILDSVGYLQTDSFSLNAVGAAPTVSLSAPANGSVISGATMLNAEC